MKACLNNKTHRSNVKHIAMFCAEFLWMYKSKPYHSRRHNSVWLKCYRKLAKAKDKQMKRKILEEGIKEWNEKYDEYNKMIL